MKCLVKIRAWTKCVLNSKRISKYTFMQILEKPTKSLEKPLFYSMLLWRSDIVLLLI